MLRNQTATSRMVQVECSGQYLVHLDPSLAGGQMFLFISKNNTRYTNQTYLVRRTHKCQDKQLATMLELCQHCNGGTKRSDRRLQRRGQPYGLCHQHRHELCREYSQGRSMCLDQDESDSTCDSRIDPMGQVAKGLAERDQGPIA